MTTDSNAAKVEAGTTFPSWELARPRLQLPAEVWEASQPVVALGAGAGFGKSTLLSQWSKQGRDSGHRIIHLTAEPYDDDGDKLLMELAAAVGLQDVQSGETVLDSYGSEGRLALVKALLAELDAQPFRTALFIDDAHHLKGRSTTSALGLMLRYQPERLLLVVSGRSHPAAALSKPLLEGRLYQFGVQELAFTEAETKELLQQHKIQPRKELVTQLLQRTEGWPAVVRLVALSLQEDEASQDAFFTGLAEGPRSLTDYLNEALLAQLPNRVHQLLLRLSLLRQFSLELATYVADMEDAGKLLEELEHRALPISRDNAEEPIYVLHPLVRDFLLQQFKQSASGEVARARERAVEWLVSRGRIEGAIEVCLDADALDAATKLINEHAAETTRTFGRHTTYLRWVNKLPAETIKRFPEIRLQQAWSLDFVRRHDEAERIRRELEQYPLTSKQHREQDAESAITAGQLEEAIELQRCIEPALRDHAEESTSRTQRWLTRWPDANSFDKAAAHCVLAFSTKALGNFNDGVGHARTAQALGRECGGYYALAWAHMLTVANLIKCGDYRQALHECDQYLEELDPVLGKWSRSVMMLHAMRAGLLYEFDRMSDAAHAIDRGLTTLIEESSTDPMIVGYVTLARLQTVQLAHLDALETLAEGEAMGTAQGLPRLTISLRAERVVLLLRQGELTQAQALWEEMESGAPARSSVHGFDRSLADKSGRIHARIALLKGHANVACELLMPVLQRAQRTGQKKKQVELLLIQAMALQESGETDNALTVFHDALDIALPEGYVRTFVDEGPPLRTLLSSYLQRPGQKDDDKRPVRRAYLDKLAAAVGLTGRDQAEPRAESSATDGQPLIEPLTTREAHILNRLQSGLSNRQLADSLFISEGTLKWHLRNVYGKLGVSNRVAAIAQARHLQLIDS